MPSHHAPHDIDWNIHEDTLRWAERNRRTEFHWVIPSHRRGRGCVICVFLIRFNFRFQFRLDESIVMNSENCDDDGDDGDDRVQTIRDEFSITSESLTTHTHHCVLMAAVAAVAIQILYTRGCVPDTQWHWQCECERRRIKQRSVRLWWRFTFRKPRRPYPSTSSASYRD